MTTFDPFVDPPVDPFDDLRADDTPIAPPAHVTARLRDLLADELEHLMNDTTVPASTPSSTPSSTPTSMPADLSVDPTVVPYLTVDGAARAIEFYVQAFGAVEHHRLVEADGRIGHAEIVIGTSRLALADEYPDYDAIAPTTRGGTSTRFTLSFPDVATLEAAFARAVELGATVVRPIADQFYGHRTGALLDPFGHQWNVGTPIPGFDDEQYREQSAEIGLDLQQSSVAAERTDDVGVHQIKHYERGDLYYFALPVPDVARAKRFFAAVLGWEFPDPDSGHAGNISAPPGGVMPADAVRGAELWFVVDDIHAAVEAVRAAGGTADEPVFYESGWSADCVDDQGTRFALSVPAARYRR